MMDVRSPSQTPATKPIDRSARLSQEPAPPTPVGLPGNLMGAPGLDSGIRLVANAGDSDRATALAPRTRKALRTRFGLSGSAIIQDGNNLNTQGTNVLGSTNPYGFSVGANANRDVLSGRVNLDGVLSYSRSSGYDQFADSHPGKGSVSSVQATVGARVQTGNPESKVRGFIGPRVGAAYIRDEFRGTLSFAPDTPVFLGGEHFTYVFGAEAGARIALNERFEAEFGVRWMQSGDNRTPVYIGHEGAVEGTDRDQTFHLTEMGPYVALRF